MPPGFAELPVEEQMLIRQFRADPEMGTVYLMTKVAQIRSHQSSFGQQCSERHRRIDKKIRGFERLKWIGAGALGVLGLLKAWILSRIFGAP
jgi:hypothetical protein